MSRAFLALLYYSWWRFVLLVAPAHHHSYMHCRWRLWQEATVLRQFLRDE